MTFLNRTCQHCNGPIAPERDWRNKYCSLKCRRRAINARRLARERGDGPPNYAHLPQAKEMVTKPDAPMPPAIDAFQTGMADRIYKLQEEMKKEEQNWEPDAMTVMRAMRDDETLSQCKERLIAEHKAKQDG